MTADSTTSAGQTARTARRGGASNGGGRVAVRLKDAASASKTETYKQKGGRKPGTESPLKRGDDVRLRILSAALDCFGAFGYEGTSTRAVAERAGVTHTLVIYHFRSKVSAVSPPHCGDFLSS